MTKIRYSASALASALSEAAKKYKCIDEWPIGTLLTFALNASNHVGGDHDAFTMIRAQGI